eukprot:scaffold242995_cov33-Prasinocladus_malaysianus.AAC.1
MPHTVSKYRYDNLWLRAGCDSGRYKMGLETTAHAAARDVNTGLSMYLGTLADTKLFLCASAA